MDEAAASASVPAMAGDPKKGEDVGVSGNDGSSGGKRRRSSDLEENATGASSHGDDAAQGNNEDAQEQVIAVPQTTASKPCAQHFARDASTPSCSCSALRCRSQSIFCCKRLKPCSRRASAPPRPSYGMDLRLCSPNGLLENGHDAIVKLWKRRG